MDGSENKARYAAHVDELQNRYDEALQSAKLDAVLIAAGTPAAIFLDDQNLPFKPNPHLVQWGPLTQHPDAILSYQRGETPELLIYAPPDYWHQTAPIPALIEEGPINVRIVSDGMDLYKHAQGLPRGTAFIGEVREREDSFGLKKVNPEKLLDQLDYQRTLKTPWEVACMQEANRVGVLGHRAAEACFAAGGSEYDIHLAFRTACKVTDNEMPYPAIVALNDHSATLHYQHLSRESAVNLSMLIDAGYAVNGYASDITRSYSDNPDFGALIEAMHELQRELCAAALPGTDFNSLHSSAHHAIANLMRETDIINCSAEQATETGLTRSFFPHGLGHFLGLQVHDVGALLAKTQARDGGKSKLAKSTQTDPSLRLARTLEPGNTLTIEPGLYFIESLLAQLRLSDAGQQVNWSRVAELQPFGGIRIEDNLHITATGNENLTRMAFAGTQPKTL
jgi:Xaa-Pro dipeptidase